MYIFSSQIKIPPGVTLAGNGVENLKPTKTSALLEVNGVGIKKKQGWEICSLDALYAGKILSTHTNKGKKRILAASHTHYAPMLDKDKPLLGHYSEKCVGLFDNAINNSRKLQITPQRCELYCHEVDVPVYRRFDYPDTVINRMLTKYAGLYPNELFKIDRNVYIFLFSNKNNYLFCFVYHACHPISRYNTHETSADYIDSLRISIRERFGIQTCIFMLGCAGDIRPNISGKRISILPRSRLNWKFLSPPHRKSQCEIDYKYRMAVSNARRVNSFDIIDDDFILCKKNLNVSGIGNIEIDVLNIKNHYLFYFYPFEVSHLYHLDHNRDKEEITHFIVSCSNDTIGYLPHYSQFSSGGYEVDSSRLYMNVPERIAVFERWLQK